jgi:hypothetical protein
MKHALFLAVLVLAAVSTRALAAPCAEEQARQAVAAAAETVARLGVEAAGAVIGRDEAFRCGGYSAKVMDYKGTWLFDLDAPGNVGRTVESYGDGAATNFMKGMIKGAISQRGTLTSYFTTDTENGVKIRKALYYVDVPGRAVIVYGAFILE